MAVSLMHQPPGFDSLRPPMPTLPRARSFDNSSLPTPSHRFDRSPGLPARSFSFQPYPSYNSSLQLPGLATLASIASQTPGHHYGHHDDLRPSMSYATAAPGQSAGGAGSMPPICGNCETSTTPLWRRDEEGNVLCNACGLFLKLHGRPRPISLKTDVIKSRNRVKASGQGAQQKKKGPFPGTGLAAAHPDLASSSSHPHAAPSATHPQQSQQPHRVPSDGFPSVDSRSSTPSAFHHTAPGLSNIAPQHMFDSTTLDGPGHHNAGLSSIYAHNSPYNIPPRNPSPSGASLLNGAAGPGSAPNSASLDIPQTYQELAASNTRLKTRVSELEVINNLFRDRVTDLEGSEAEARRQLESSLKRERELRARLEELGDGAAARVPSPSALAPSDGNDERRPKRLRLSDMVDDDAGPSPTSGAGLGISRNGDAAIITPVSSSHSAS